MSIIKELVEELEHIKNKCETLKYVIFFDGVLAIIESKYAVKEKDQLSNKDDLIEAQKEYIKFISEEYNLVFPIAQIHGFYYNDKTIAKGESLRKRILELTNKQ